MGFTLNADRDHHGLDVDTLIVVAQREEFTARPSIYFIPNLTQRINDRSREIAPEKTEEGDDDYPSDAPARTPTSRASAVPR